MRKLKVLDLFSGIGGFSLGLERTGFFETVAFCEQDKYCQEVLQKHWKGVKIYDDIKKLEGKEIQDRHGRIDICTGGVPCQPFSVADKQNGTNDDRYLWPDMFRIIEQLEPTFVIIENVKGLINIQDGMVFETVCSDLESEGFEVQAFVIPAAGVGAPHKRERVWIVGHSEYNGSLTAEIERRNFEIDAWTQERENQTSEFKRASRPGNYEIMENSRRSLRQRSSLKKKNENEIRKEDADMFKRSSSSSEFNVANTTSKRLEGQLRSKLQGTREGSTNSSEKQTWWSVEPDVGRVAHGVPGRAHRLRALGNSIVPKIAEEIGRAIVTAKNN